MQISSHRFTYDIPQRFFHWSMAALILVAIGLGFWAGGLPPGTSPRRELLEVHKSLGMLALALLVLRIVYRLAVGEPRYRAELSPLVHRAAQLGHLGLYALMLFMPVTGYLFSAAGGYSLSWFWLFSWPRLVPLDKALAHQGQELHDWGAWVIAIVLAVHVAAVVWHQGIKRDEVLSRMWPSKGFDQRGG